MEVGSSPSYWKSKGVERPGARKRGNCRRREGTQRIEVGSFTEHYIHLLLLCGSVSHNECFVIPIKRVLYKETIIHTECIIREIVVIDRSLAVIFFSAMCSKIIHRIM